jgi:hypothetical protein
MTVEVAARRGPISTERLWAILGLAALAAGLLYGHWAGREQRLVEATVKTYVEAIARGDRSAAEALSTSSLIRESSLPRDQAADWSDPVKLRIVSVEATIKGEAATATAIVEREGFRLTPEFTLQRDSGGHWLIAGIGNLSVDPSWDKVQESERRLEGEALAGELAESLGVPLTSGESPGVAAGSGTEP